MNESELNNILGKYQDELKARGFSWAQIQIAVNRKHAELTEA